MQKGKRIAQLPPSNRVTGSCGLARVLPRGLISNVVTGNLARPLRVCTCRAMGASGALSASLFMWLVFGVVGVASAGES